MVSVRYFEGSWQGQSGRPAVRQGYPRQFPSRIASFCRKQPRRWVRSQNRHAHTMCRNDQSGIVAMAATLCGSEAAKLTAAMRPAAPALAEVAAAVASFSRCPRFFATRLSCSVLAFREAGGSRPRQSEPSSFVLPAWVERLDGPAQRWAETEQACNDPSGYDNNDKCALQQGVCQVRNGAYAEHIAESAAVLQVLRESQPSSRREPVLRQSWCVLHWSAMECPGCRAPPSRGRRELDPFPWKSRVRYGARSASLDAKR